MDYRDFERCVLGAWNTDPISEICDHLKKEKENDMKKSCNNCANKDCFAGSLECRGCELNISPYHKGYLNRWVSDVNHKSTYIKEKTSKPIPTIKDVIFNPPATIIIWEDHTKTVVKCGEGDIYDPEKGMAMAISRKALGDRGSYYNVFEKWLEKCNVNLCDTCACRSVDASLSPCWACKYNPNKKTDNGETKTGEVSNSDISEAEVKRCFNCKYKARTASEYPCKDCSRWLISKTYHHPDKWEPKESDD